LKSTPILSLHQELGAEIGSFAGWRSPLWFSTVRAEHNAVRTAAGIFDISHMTRIMVRGPGATSLLKKTLTYNVDVLKEGRMKYCLMLNRDAGIIDDLTVYRVAGDIYLIVSNAATRERVLQWLEEQGGGAGLDDVTESSALLAIQGPSSPSYVSRWLGDDVGDMKWFSGRVSRLDACPIIITRSGYTGGDGYELCLLCGGGERFAKVFTDFLSMGVKPCGLACRDILRLEAGFPLYGQDMDENVSPIEARLTWAVRLENEAFIGREAFLARMERGPSKLLVGLEMDEPGIPRPGYRVLDYSGVELGRITSGGHSYYLEKGIALGYVSTQYAVDGAMVQVDLRGKLRRARVRLEPFIKLNIPKP